VSITAIQCHLAVVVDLREAREHRRREVAQAEHEAQELRLLREPVHERRLDGRILRPDRADRGDDAAGSSMLSRRPLGYGWIAM